MFVTEKALHATEYAGECLDIPKQRNAFYTISHIGSHEPSSSHIAHSLNPPAPVSFIRFPPLTYIKETTMLLEDAQMGKQDITMSWRAFSL